MEIVFSAESIPGTSAYRGIVKVAGDKKTCGHRHSLYTSAKGCAELRKMAKEG